VIRLLPLILLAGCPDPSETGSDTDPDTTPAGCDVIDCADPACATAFECTWPTSLTHSSSLIFTGTSITCSVGGFPLPVDVPDCATELSATLTERTTGDLCASCDKTYEGAITYAADTCSELLNQAAPTSGAWGFIFNSETQRTLYLSTAAGWVDSGTFDLLDGVWTSVTSDSVTQVPPSCGSDAQYVGDITVTALFTDQ